MNDIHGIAPNAINTPNELRALLSGFGPYTSRYVLTLPGHKLWQQAVLSHFSHLGELDQKRLSIVLAKAKERSVFIDQNLDYWPFTKTWLINALTHWQSRPNYKPIYASNEEYLKIAEEYPEHIRNLFHPDEIYEISAAEDEINTEPEDYWKVSAWLCQISAEIHFIDPYLDNAQKDVSDVFCHYIQQITKLTKPTSIHFWTRRDKNLTEGQRIRIDEKIKLQISQFIQIGRKNIVFKFHLIDDEKSVDKLHARYLLTEKGGMKFDQGFQRIRPLGRKNIVSPIGEALHQKLFKQFSKNENNFLIANTILLKK